jgi:hypothetical protein
MPSQNISAQCCLTIEKAKKTEMSMKPFKSAGGDGITSKFYQLYWAVIEKGVVNKVLNNFELSDSQNNRMIMLLHKGGYWDNIRNWGPIATLNTDYKLT